MYIIFCHAQIEIRASLLISEQQVSDKRLRHIIRHHWSTCKRLSYDIERLLSIYLHHSAWLSQEQQGPSHGKALVVAMLNLLHRGDNGLHTVDAINHSTDDIPVLCAMPRSPCCDMVCFILGNVNPVVVGKRNCLPFLLSQSVLFRYAFQAPRRESASLLI